MYFGSKKVYDYDWCVCDGAGTVCYCRDLWQVWSWVTTMLHRSVPTSCLSPCTTQTMPMRCLVSGVCDWMCVMQAWLWQGTCVMQLWSISTCIQNFTVCSNLFLLPANRDSPLMTTAFTFDWLFTEMAQFKQSWQKLQREGTLFRDFDGNV